MKKYLYILVIILFLSIPSHASSIVLLNSTSQTSFQDSILLLESQNSYISHRYPPNILIGENISPNATPLILLISSQAVNSSKYPNHSRIIIESWNKNLLHQSPLYSPNIPLTYYNTIPNDTIKKQNILSQQNIITPNPLLIYGASSIDLSEYFIGNIAVGVIFPESIINSTEDWTEDEEINVISEVRNGLDWWISKEPLANITFTYDIHYKVPTIHEPINNPADFYGNSGQALWISDVMTHLNHTNLSDYYENVVDYDNHIRNTLSTDWVFTILIIDSSNDTDGRFADGYFAYASVGGPFFVMTYDNNGYSINNMDAVVAHETGHIFYANDQYLDAQSPCTETSGYLNIENQNSQFNCLSNSPSIMRGAISPFTSHSIDTYAKQQLGWKDSNTNSILDIIDFPPTTFNISFNDSHILSAITSSRYTLPSLNPAPYSSKNSITINKVKSIQYKINNDTYIPINISIPINYISYTINLSNLPPGNHTIFIKSQSTSSLINISEFNFTIYPPKAIQLPTPTPTHTIIEFVSSSAQHDIVPSSISISSKNIIAVPVKTITKHEFVELTDHPLNTSTPAENYKPLHYAVLIMSIIISLALFVKIEKSNPQFIPAITKIYEQLKLK